MDEYGVALSRSLGTRVIGGTNHDDDALILWVFENGTDVAHLNTAPGALSGADLPAALRGVEHFAAVAGQDDETMRALLLTLAVFAVEHHHQIVTALGLPEYSAGFGFRYAERGEFAHVNLVKFGH